MTRARDITVAVTALRSLEGRDPVLRSGARPGDLVAIHGRLGCGCCEVWRYSARFRSPRVLVEAHRVPQIGYGAGADAARAGATSMIDISDGLLADLGHVARASNVLIDLRRDAFELARTAPGSRRCHRRRSIQLRFHRRRGPRPGGNLSSTGRHTSRLVRSRRSRHRR